MPVVRHAERRRTETPNAAMTTLASPTQGSASQALWRVDMHPDATGPLHTMDVEQVWTVLDGAATVTLGGDEHRVARGDTVVLPAGVPRQVHADEHEGMAALVTAPAGGLAYRDDGSEPVAPPWTT